jgi:hypothetical protein
MTLLAQTSHSGLTIQAIDLLYLQIIGLQCVQEGYDKHSHPTWLKAIPKLAFWPQDKEDKFHPQGK